MMQRLIWYWPYGGFLAGILLLALAPLLLSGWPAPLAATFLLLPAYMLHQYEEHDGDRFRLFFNATIGGDHEVLTPLAVFITNVPGVWGVMALALYGAAEVNLGWALVAVYLVLVNAAAHVAHAIVFRRYNPGLATALVVFVPLGIIALRQISGAGADGAGWQAAGLAVAVAIHAVILVHVLRRRALLRRSAGKSA